MNEKLKLCPFCGGDLIERERLYCHNDRKCWMPAVGVRKELFSDILLWNNRPLEDALQAEVERLSNILDSVAIECNEPFCDNSGFAGKQGIVCQWCLNHPVSRHNIDKALKGGK